MLGIRNYFKLVLTSEDIFLKELEFRYNFRDNIDDSLYKCLGGIN
jgi:hypothetical protein